MRPGAVRVETVGSYWWLDDDAGEYLRTPKIEAPRDETRGPLVDLVWHPMVRWERQAHPVDPRLRILVPDDGTPGPWPHPVWITAPLVVDR